MKLMLLALLLPACAAQVDGPFYVSDRFNQAQEQQLAQAARSWEVASGGALRIDLIFGQHLEPTLAAVAGKRVIIPLSSNEWTSSDLHLDYTPRPGLTVGGDGYQAILLDLDTFGATPLNAVVMHEFGHAIGLLHVAGTRALMCGPRIGEPDVICDYTDLERFVTGQCIANWDARALHQLMPADVRLCQ